MDIVLRATAMFAILYVLLRILGKREVGQLTTFEFVTIVALGDLIQQAVTHNDFSITGATLAVSTFAFWGLVLSWLSFKSPRLEKLLDGQPRVVIRDGEVLRANMRRDRLTMADLFSEMRLAGIAHVEDVAWAILETQGKISFIEKKRSSDSSVPRGDQAGGRSSAHTGA